MVPYLLEFGNQKSRVGLWKIESTAGYLRVQVVSGTSRASNGTVTQCSSPAYRIMFAMAVMRNEFVKSIRKAPTMGTTRKACGAGPYFSTSSSLQATALAGVPSMKPQKARGV